MEFWFAIIKVVAVVAMILFGAWLLFAATAACRRRSATCGIRAVSAARLHRAGNDDGDHYVLFGGLELVGITAAEADNPEKSIPKATNRVIYHRTLFSM